jgi:leucyl/phenylalanyl-tRNA--protein transferase
MAQHLPITADLVVQAYCQGVFPMAMSRQGRIGWYSPDPRGIIPLEGFRVPRSLAKRVRNGGFRITRDAAFGQVIRLCAHPRAYEGETWINDQIIGVYSELHGHGVAHSVEAWLPRSAALEARRRYGAAYGFGDDAAPDEPVIEARFVDDEHGRDGRGTGTAAAALREPWQLVGGLYGVALGGAFFGESMFSRAHDASKVCLVHLVEHMRRQGFTLLDVQFSNHHLAQFGVTEISRGAFLERLEAALSRPRCW